MTDKIVQELFDKDSLIGGGVLADNLGVVGEAIEGVGNMVGNVVDGLFGFAGDVVETGVGLGTSIVQTGVDLGVDAVGAVGDVAGATVGAAGDLAGATVGAAQTMIGDKPDIMNVFELEATDARPQYVAQAAGSYDDFEDEDEHYQLGGYGLPDALEATEAAPMVGGGCGCGLPEDYLSSEYQVGGMGLPDRLDSEFF